MVGVDPEKALGGEKPMFDFQFVEGSRQEALEKLKRGRYCLVPDHFQRESGLGVGGKFAVIPPESPQQRVEYEIAGVVSMTGWHWMSKVGLRNRGGGRSAALMFAPFAEVRRDFAIDRTTYFWMNLDGTATEDEIKESLQTIAQRNFDINLAKARQRGRGPMGEMGFGGGRRRGYTASVNLQSAEDGSQNGQRTRGRHHLDPESLAADNACRSLPGRRQHRALVDPCPPMGHGSAARSASRVSGSSA